MAKIRIAKDPHGWVYGHAFYCEGCDQEHLIDDRWTFNKDLNNPTFDPSLHITYKHPKGYSNDNPAPKNYDGEYIEDVCHSFIRDGMIEYLTDCTHELAGKTIELKEYYNGS